MAAERESCAGLPVVCTCAIANRSVGDNARLHSPIAGDDGQYPGFDISVDNAGAAINRRAVGCLEQRHATVVGDWRRLAVDPPIGGTHEVRHRFAAATARLPNAVAGDGWQYSGVDTSVGDAGAAINRRAVRSLEQRYAVLEVDRERFAVGLPIGGIREVRHRFAAATARLPDAIAGDHWQHSGDDTSVGNVGAAINRRAVRNLEQRHATVASDPKNFAAGRPIGGTRTVRHSFAAANARLHDAIHKDF